MNKHYFIDVRTYQSVNNMGLELGKYVEKKYNHVVVAAEDFGVVATDIKEKMKELEKKYPRSRPFKYETGWKKDRYGLSGEVISVKPDSTYNDNFVFIMETTVIRNEVEVKEGGRHE